MADDDDDRDDGPCLACGGAVQWAPLYEGKTCGGLLVRGAWVCACGEARVGAATRAAEGAWTLAASGRSVETGTGRVRVDGGDVEGLCARIVRLPTLELIADLVRAGDVDSARAVAEGLDGAPVKAPRQGELFGAVLAQGERAPRVDPAQRLADVAAAAERAGLTPTTWVRQAAVAQAEAQSPVHILQRALEDGSAYVYVRSTDEPPRPAVETGYARVRRMRFDVALFGPGGEVAWPGYERLQAAFVDRSLTEPLTWEPVPVGHADVRVTEIVVYLPDTDDVVGRMGLAAPIALVGGVAPVLSVGTVVP